MTRTVLLVDDEPALRMTLAANLELEGFSVFEAESAEHALQLVASETFDVILTDICMPGMNGVELFRKLRASRIHTPILLMTAFANEDLVQSALEEGAFALLLKPFDVEGAIRTLANAAREPSVMVVDDAVEVAESTRGALSAAGLRASAATSGAAAIDGLKSGSVDVCVIDLVMPGMSGADLAVHIRALDPDVTMIATSGYEVPDMIRRMAAMGMHTFLRKPFDMRQLIRAIAIARGARGTAAMQRKVPTA
jgi:DNA-binding NtrC family response regulator